MIKRVQESLLHIQCFQLMDFCSCHIFLVLSEETLPLLTIQLLLQVNIKQVMQGARFSIILCCSTNVSYIHPKQHHLLLLAHFILPLVSVLLR